MTVKSGRHQIRVDNPNTLPVASTGNISAEIEAASDAERAAALA